jgi:hypothetical protein
METSTASALCKKHGAILLRYQLGRFAVIALPSGEELFLSLGLNTIKVMEKRGVFGFFLPRVIAKKKISEWAPAYRELQGIPRLFMATLLLDGLIWIISKMDSSSHVKMGWCVLRNPLDVAMEEKDDFLDVPQK